MQKRILFFIISVFLFSASVFAQDLNRKISIKADQASLEEILSIISDKGNIYFSFNPQSLPQGKKYNLDIRNKSIRYILDHTIVPEGIMYQVTENQVVLKGNGIQPGGDVVKEPKRYTVNGFLRDKASGEALIGANVYDKETFTGTITNAYGFYSLTLPEGVHTIVASYVSYRKSEKLYGLMRNEKLNFDLEEVPVEMKEVEVFSGNGKSLIENEPFRITSSQLSALPGFAGEQDVIRSLQVVPGIQTYGEGSTLFYVRGGNSDQNLILIDDAPIFNPSHMFGFFSVLAPDAIREVDIYKGDFSASYGGRLSSVIDIKAKNGNLKNFGFSGNIGPFASSLSVEGPVIKDKGSFFVSGRLSTVNWLKFMNRTSTDFKINFYDINAKLNYKINSTNRLFLTFYYGKDAFDRTTESSIITYGISWDNLAGILRWNHTFSPRLFSNTTAYYSRYSYFLYTSRELNQYWISLMENLAVKNDLTWYLSPKNTVKAGFEVASHHSNPGNVNFKFSKEQESLKEIPEYHALDYAIYATDEFKLGKKLELDIGIRLTLWQDLGPTKVYYFNVNHNVIDTMSVNNGVTYAWYLRPEPRLSIRYMPDDLSQVKLNYSRNTQFMQVLSNSTSPFTSLEVWTFSGPNVQPRIADQVAVGYSRLLRRTFDVSANAYFKWISNNIDYEDHADMFYNPLIEGEIRAGEAWAYGLELMLRKQRGDLTGWIAYTWSRAFIRTNEVNGGKEYPAFYDRPHNFSINLSYTSRRFTFSGNWVLVSGAVITTPVGFYYLNGYSVPVYGDKNNDRLPVYHRLDLSAAYVINNKTRKYQHSLVLTLYNVYGNDNPFSIGFNRIKSGDEYVVPSDLSGNYQIVPTVLSVAGIIPSINYLFRF